MIRAAVLALLLAGCAREGAPVGHGGTHRIVSANPASVTVEYDPMLGGVDLAMSAANQHCGANGKHAVPTHRGGGSLPFQVFECR